MIANGGHPVAMSDLIGAHTEHLRSAGQSPRTIGEREQVLRRLHRDLPFGLAWAETDQLESWLSTVTAGRSQWTLITYGNHIRAFYGWADGRFLDGDPAAALARPRRPRLTPRPATDEQLQRLLEQPDPWWRLVVLLASLAGLRVSEIAQLRREHVTRDVIRIVRGKGGDAATVPTHPRLWAEIGPRPRGLLAPMTLRQTGDQLTRLAREYFRELGLWPGLTMHQLRHWYGTALLTSSGDVRLVQELLRHQSITSTQGYTRVAVGRTAIALMGLTLPGLG